MAIKQRNMQISKDILAGKLEGNVYRGQDAKIIYVDKSEKDISKYKVTGSLGPMRAPTNLRASCRFDYAPGICKDYKETGFCGFGDSCVFMHDRGDYKTGWEQEEEWKREQREKQKLIQEGKYNPDEPDEENYEISEEGQIPKTCQICDNDYTEPVVTKCGHYFCERCALKHYAKSSTCYTCHKGTSGIFNSATSIIEKISQKRAKNLMKQNKAEKVHFNVNSKINEDTFGVEEDDEAGRSDMAYLNSRDKIAGLSSEFEEQEEIITSKKKKGNNFKVQNSWLYTSDFKNYGNY